MYFLSHFFFFFLLLFIIFFLSIWGIEDLDLCCCCCGGFRCCGFRYFIGAVDSLQEREINLFYSPKDEQ
jgi:hypothetical protein